MRHIKTSVDCAIDPQKLIFGPPQPGTVLYLPGLPGGGSKIQDRSIYANNGTITGATWKCMPSGLWVLDFDGTDDSVSLGILSSISLDSSDFSILCWIQLDAASEQWILKQAFGANTLCLRVFNSHMSNYATPTGTTGWDTGQGSANVADGAWHHIGLIVKRGVSVEVYCDGVYDVSDYSVGSGSLGTLSGTALGRESLGVNQLNGRLALLTIIKRGLSVFEVSGSYLRQRWLFVR